MTKELFQIALNITDPWFVTDLKFDVESERLDVYVNFKKGSTFGYYNKKEDKEYAGLKAYDTSNKTWKHLNFFEHKCYLHARVPRVKLPNGKVKQIQTPWEGLSNGFTLLFEASLLQLCQAMPVNKVAAITKVSDDKLWCMLDKNIGTRINNEDI